MSGGLQFSIYGAGTPVLLSNGLRVELQHSVDTNAAFVQGICQKTDVFVSQEAVFHQCGNRISQAPCVGSSSFQVSLCTYCKGASTGHVIIEIDGKSCDVLRCEANPQAEGCPKPPSSEPPASSEPPVTTVPSQPPSYVPPVVGQPPSCPLVEVISCNPFLEDEAGGGRDANGCYLQRSCVPNETKPLLWIGAFAVISALGYVYYRAGKKR